MENRIDTLLEKFGLEDRKYENLKHYFSDEEANVKLFCTDYSHVPQILESERRKADDFYKLCFDSEEQKNIKQRG